MAVRTKSYIDFFTKAQFLVNEPSSPSHCHHRFSEILLEPGQETIAAILESAILSKKSDLKALLFNYFEISAEASKICSHLLKSINQVQSNYKFIQQVLDTIDDSACGLVAITAMVLAAHTLSALLLGPAIFVLPVKPLKKKLLNFRFFRSGFLRKIGKQLDVAAKGTYILNRDFDTMSRLVSRLHDEIEHNKAMVQFCLERSEDKLSLQVLKELKKSDFGLRKQVEELEEHVYLCLMTINKTRALVIKEISTSCVEDLPQ
ncbi:unnamed protein product [Ilex paraguariensis]|uniref:Uncharacterized protein n=1 Tax=Ilex paraguariensis TaxID=185542 RepID=A0ABC8SA97_9AQUA